MTSTLPDITEQVSTDTAKIKKESKSKKSKKSSSSKSGPEGESHSRKKIIKKKKKEKSDKPRKPPPVDGPPNPGEGFNPRLIVPEKPKPKKTSFWDQVKPSCCIDYNKNNQPYIFYVDARQIFHSQIYQNAIVLGEGSFGTVNEIVIRGSKLPSDFVEKNKDGVDGSSLSKCQLVQNELMRYDRNMESLKDSQKRLSMGEGVHMNDLTEGDNSNFSSPHPQIPPQLKILHHQSSTTTIDSNLSMISSIHSTQGKEPERQDIMTLKLAMKRLPLSNEDKNKYHQKDSSIAEQATVAGCAFIVAYYGHVLYDGQYCILMEKCDTSLNLFNGAARKLGFAINKGVPLAFMQKLTYNLIESLKFLKDKLQVMHRDVKPSNILLTKNMEIKLCDFGIAGSLNRSRTNPITGGIGSHPYMSPERQLHDPRYVADPTNLHREQYNDRADVWAVGLTLMETMVGEYPYGREWKTPHKGVGLTALIMNNEPPSFKTKWAEKAPFYTVDQCRSSSEEDCEETPIPRSKNSKSLRRSDSEPLSDLSSSNSNNSDNDTIVDAFSKISLKSEKSNGNENNDNQHQNQKGDFLMKNDEKKLEEDTQKIEENRSPSPMKSKSVPGHKEQSNGQQLIDFITQCLYKDWIEKPDKEDSKSSTKSSSSSSKNSTSQKINPEKPKKIRPNYEELQKTDYYKNITRANNKPNSVRLKDYFDKVFEKLPEYIEERKERMRQ